jgi:hypothetical protein
MWLTPDEIYVPPIDVADNNTQAPRGDYSGQKKSAKKAPNLT